MIGRHLQSRREGVFNDFKTLTRNGNIKSVAVKSNYPANGRSAHITYTIHYNDGRSLRAFTIAELEWGRWRVGIIPAIMEAEREQKKKESI